MPQQTYYIVNDTTEDRFDEVESLEEALRIARAVIKENPPGDPVSIEHKGKVIRQLVLTTDGKVKEELVQQS